MTRYEQFNEMTFEAYCKTAIDRSIIKERMRKAARRQWEQPFSSFPDVTIQSIPQNDAEIIARESDPMTFLIQGEEIQVNDLMLGQALYLLLPREREIIMLYYFALLRDDKIADRLAVSRATVQRQRRRAEIKLKQLLEGGL